MVAIKTQTASGFDVAAIAAMRFGQIVEEHRFPDRGERALCRLGDDFEEFYPDADVLARRGFNIAAIAIALKMGRISAEAVGDLVERVRLGLVDLDDANQSLYRLALAIRRGGKFLDDVTLAGFGFNVELLSDVLEVEAITPRELGELVSNVLRGDLSLANAHSGLEHVYDMHMSERRRAA